MSDEDQLLQQFAGSAFIHLMGAERDSPELTTAVNDFMTFLQTNPSLKFSRITQFCCQYVDAHADQFRLKSTMVPMRLTQYIKTSLMRRKEYTEEYIAKVLPGYLDNFLAQQEKKKRKQEAADAAAATAPLSEEPTTQEEEQVTTDSCPTAAEPPAKRKKKSSPPPPPPPAAQLEDDVSLLDEVAAASSSVTVASAPITDDVAAEYQSIAAKFQPPATTAVLPVSAAAAVGGAASAVSPHHPLVHNESQAIETALFILHNSVYHIHRSNDDVTTVFGVVSELLKSLKMYFSVVSK